MKGQINVMRRFSGAALRLAVAAVAATVAGALATPVSTAEGVDPVAGAPEWNATYEQAPLYPGVHIDWDVPVTMSDGTVLKANVYRPMDAGGRIVETPTPTLVNLTPYTKLASMLGDSAMSVPVLYDSLVTLMNRFDLFDLNGTPVSGAGDLVRTLSGGLLRNFAVDRKMLQSGYTQVVVDVRGTGFSQGIWEAFGAREQQDTLEVIDWAANQPWSNGSIGMTGVSYSAINQVQAAGKQPAALKAIFPVVPGSDLVRDTAAPGGGVGVGFLPFWVGAIDASKLLPDLASVVQGRFDWKWLADRVASPVTYLDLMIQALFVPSVDAIPPHLREFLNPDGAFRSGLFARPENIRVPTFVVGGWHDIFAYSEPQIYRDIPLPPGQKQLLMGDWYHVTAGSGLGTPGAPPRLDVLQRAWFDRWLKGIDNGIDRFGPTTVYQQGAGWVSGGEYPAAAAEHRRVYLSANPSGTTGPVVHDGSLSADVPGPATLTVAPGLSTLCSRDAAQITAGVLSLIDACAKDSRIAETAALTFTGTPVAEPTRISGPVAVHLNTVLDATDGYWTVTVNDVAPDGQSTVLTSGQLVSSLRAIDEDKSERSANGDYTDPYHHLTLETRQPIVPGEPTTLDIALAATDAVLQPGHRLRVDVFASNFPKGMLIPALLIESQLRPQHLVLDPESPSWINIPTDRPL
ncbi:CocE/NonD family hydrolase [Nocardia sp. NPDC057668]|uniref:CocE/NonD family hydrolase n=1 Tax=Nocardia sp. NPDC057668 TaxID=3346202 RepID=UPI00366CC0F2